MEIIAIILIQRDLASGFSAMIVERDTVDFLKCIVTVLELVASAVQIIQNSYMELSVDNEGLANG